MRLVPLTNECLEFLRGVESVLASMAILNSLLTRLTLVTIFSIQNLVTHALLFTIAVLEGPAFFALQALAIFVQLGDIRVASVTRGIRLTFILLAVDAIDN